MMKGLKKIDSLTALSIVILVLIVLTVLALILAPPHQEGCYWLMAVCDDGLHEMECVAGHEIDPAGHVAILPDGQMTTVKAMVYLKFCGDNFFGTWKTAWHLVGECEVVTGRSCKIER